MKRIAVFCDGTWNSADQEHSTNVYKLFKATEEIEAGSETQRKIYIEGVGTGRGETAFQRRYDKVVGGALGWGLDRVLEEAYRELSELYEPGDDVMLFGFSRGAYTARSLAGLIRNCGIPSEDTMDRIGEAMALYRARGADSSPDAERSLAFRKTFSPAVATSWKDLQLRDDDASGQCALFELSYLGVWDTVGALGIPTHYGSIARFWNAGKYQFHDTDLSSSVAAARHAVSIDETRRTFPATLWYNLATLNRRAGPGGFYQQIWFPGDHGSVGGGGDITGLSNLAMAWIADGAQKRGLSISEDAIEAWRTESDIAAPLRNTSNPPNLLTRLMLKNTADREGPWDANGVAKHVIERWGRDEAYRPGALRRVRSEIAWRLRGF